MDIIPLLKTKLVVPEIPDKALYSTRLKKLNIAGHRAVIINAPAGFGKTTAVLLATQKERSRVHWYRMEKEDSFLQVFYAHLIETLFGREAEGMVDSVRSLGSIGNLSEEYPLLNAVICQDAWTIYTDNKDHHAYMVFDDFHNAVGNSAIVETLKYFMVNMPPKLRIIIISRSGADVLSGRLTLNGDVVIIDEQALRFSKEETAKLITEIYNINMDKKDIDRMYGYSEGWISGITMLRHSMGHSLPDMRMPLVSSDDGRQSIFRYFVSEALEGYGIDRVKHLAGISILEDFTCEDLKMVLGIENAEETLAWLVKSNMYIQKIKAKVISYRFHFLFRSALNSLLYDMFTPEEVEELNLKAAYHYKNLGRYDYAIRFLLTSDRVEEAAKIACDEGVRFMDAGDTDSVTSIIHVFPESLIQGNPYLMFLKGASLMSSELDQSYKYIYEALSGFNQSGDLALLMKAVGLMISISYQKNDLNNIKSVVSHIPKLKAITKSKYARITLLFSAFMNTAWSDKLNLGEKLYKVVERLDFYEPLWDYTFKMAKTVILYRKGNLEAAKEMIPQLLHHPTALVNDRWRSIGLAIIHAVTSQIGDLEASQKIMEELLSIGEKYSSDYAIGYGLRLSAYIRYQSWDIKGAVSQMDSSINAFTRYGNFIMASVGRITKYHWESEYMPVEPLTEKAFKELGKLMELKPGQGFLEHCEVIVGAIYKKSGNYAEAERLLLKAYRTSTGKKAHQSICGAVMHLAELYHRKNDVRLEDKYLKAWGKSVSDNNYVYFREMDYSTLVWICARCIEKQIFTDHMKKIIGKYFGADSAAKMAESPKQASTDPQFFISGVSITHQVSICIRVKLFGSFKLTVDGKEIGENEWKTRKISGILKYILANPEKAVSRETLATLFWPESNSKAAFTSLRAALYELRKTLGRFGLAFESENALIAEDNNGFHICGRNAIETDIDVFTALYSKYKSGKPSPEEAKSLLAVMVSIYEGDFLEDDPYDEWIDVSREHYRSIFIEVSHKLAKQYIADGELEKAEELLVHHMKVDPFDENACGILISLLIKTGQNSRSSSLRRQFEKRFEKEMGIKPTLTSD